MSPKLAGPRQREARRARAAVFNNGIPFVLFLFLYGCVLMTFALLAFGVTGLHHDMTEAWAWGQELQLGYWKHPPLSAWLTRLWFSLWPRREWSFFLLSTVNVAVALAGVWTLAGLFLDKRGRWMAVCFLALTPSFNVWALNFNANAPLLSTWPWATYFFLQSLKKRQTAFALCAGVLGAMALLAKYYSITLLGTLLAVAVLHPCRRRYFSSVSPYITVAAGLALMLPHIFWTVGNGFPTLRYAMSKTQYGVLEARASIVGSVLVSVGLLGIPFIACLTAFGARSWELLRRAIAGTFKARNAWLVALAWGPLLLTVAAYLVGNVRITTRFLIPVFFAVPVVFLVLSETAITDTALRRVAIFLSAIWLMLTLASPLLGYFALAHARDMQVEPREEIAAAVTEYWHAAFDQPLRVVGGEERLATAVTFFSSDAPSYFDFHQPDHSPWASVEDVRRYGFVIVCPAQQQACLDQAATFVDENARHLTREFAKSFLGRTAKPQQFVFIAQPPGHGR
jgi:4-amino-4-deoxy-L-arabinose transferase-like glycosyltransferase